MSGSRRDAEDHRPTLDECSCCEQLRPYCREGEQPRDALARILAASDLTAEGADE